MKVKKLLELTKKLDTLDIILISFANLGSWPIILSFLGYANTKLQLIPLITIQVFLLFLLLRKYLKLFKEPIKNLGYVLVPAIFIILIFVYLFSIIDNPYPILHDPIAHSYWTKTIIDTGRIEYFYSPFLHTTTLITYYILSPVSNITHPEALQIVTSLSLAILPLLIGTIITKLINPKDNKKVQLILIFSIFSVALFDFPSRLYYTAGKNAFIYALPLAMLTFFYAINIAKEKTKQEKFRSLIFFLLGSIILFLTHYPTFGIIALLTAPIIIQIFLDQIRGKNYKDFLRYIIMGTLGGLFIIFWYFYHSQFDGQNSTVIGSVRRFDFNILGRILRSTRSYLPLATNNFEILVFTFLGILGVASFKKTKLSLYFLWILLAPQLLIIFISFGQIGTLGIVSKTMAFSYDFLVYVVAIYLILKLFNQLKIHKSQQFIIISLILLVSLMILSDRYSIFKDKSISIQTIQQEDIDAFEYINTNVPDNKLFLNSVIKDPNRPRIHFPTDSAAWLPNLTGNPLVFDFQNFSADLTNQNYELYLDVIGDDEERAVVALNELIDQGAEYLYLEETGKLGPQMDIKNISKFLNLIYENDQIRIYKILDPL